MGDVPKGDGRDPPSVSGGAAEADTGVPQVDQARTPKLTGVPLLVVVLGVTGTAALPAAVGRQFSLNITRYPSSGAVQKPIDLREIDGGLIASPRGATLLVVPAAGFAGRRHRPPSEADGRPGPQAAGGRCRRSAGVQLDADACSR